jgi:flagellar biosynthesis/type III secretory pathway chaperone
MNSLTEVLQMLTDLHITLLETAKKKQEILISAEINPLLAIMADESKLIKKIKEADEMRMEVLEHDQAYLPLAKLIEHQPDGETKLEWTSKLDLLKQLFQEIERVNKLNQQLLQQSLNYTQFMIEQMLPKTESSGLYRSEALAQESREYARLFDLKA